MDKEYIQEKLKFYTEKREQYVNEYPRKLYFIGYGDGAIQILNDILKDMEGEDNDN